MRNPGIFFLNGHGNSRPQFECWILRFQIAVFCNLLCSKRKKNFGYATQKRMILKSGKNVHIAKVNMPYGKRTTEMNSFYITFKH